MRLFSNFAFYSLLTCVLAAGGCISRTTGLRFTSTSTGKQYGQNFTRAYFTHSEQGDYDIILIDDGLTSSASRQRGPLQPVGDISLNQFVHLHVLWKPLHGNKPDTPSTTNAIIDWFVRTNEFVDQPDRLHYRGPGYVSVYDGSDVARFVVRAGKLGLLDSTGQLRDPLGQTNLTGSFKALNNPQLVASLMAAQKRELSTTPPPAVPTNDMMGPPPRSPMP